MDTREAGRKGGRLLLEKYGREYFKRMSEKAVIARRLKKEQRIKEGESK